MRRHVELKRRTGSQACNAMLKVPSVIMLNCLCHCLISRKAQDQLVVLQSRSNRTRRCQVSPGRCPSWRYMMVIQSQLIDFEVCRMGGQVVERRMKRLKEKIRWRYERIKHQSTEYYSVIVVDLKSFLIFCQF